MKLNDAQQHHSVSKTETLASLVQETQYPLANELSQVLREQYSSVVSAFKAFDKNANSRITQEEFEQGFRSAGVALCETDVRDVWKHLDDNGDGWIGYMEFEPLYHNLVQLGRTTSHTELKQSPQIQQREARLVPIDELRLFLKQKYSTLVTAFRAFDRNHDSRITQAEFERGFHSAGVDLSEADVRNLWRYLDENGDGWIGYVEFEHVFSNFAHVRRPTSQTELGGIAEVQMHMSSNHGRPCVVQPKVQPYETHVASSPSMSGGGGGINSRPLSRCSSNTPMVAADLSMHASSPAHSPESFVYTQGTMLQTKGDKHSATPDLDASTTASLSCMERAFTASISGTPQNSSSDIRIPLSRPRSAVPRKSPSETALGIGESTVLEQASGAGRQADAVEEDDYSDFQD